jgi:hypothetical protein
MAANPDAQRGRSLSTIPVAGWIALAFVSIFAVLFLTVGPRHDPYRTSAPDRRNLAQLLGVPRHVSPDGTLVLVFQPADRGCIHEGTRVTFHRHRVGRLAEVDPGLGGILARIVFRRDFVRKAMSMTSTLVPRRSRADPSVTEVAVLGSRPTLDATRAWSPCGT